MTLVLNLPPHTEQKLQELAAQHSQDLADYALGVIQSHVEANVGGPAADTSLLEEAVARMTGRNQEQIAKAQARATAFIRPGKPLRDGETILDAVAGKWPGAESDQEIAEAIRRLS